MWTHDFKNVVEMLFCDNNVIIADWKKNKKKIYISEVLIFWKRTVTVNLKKFSLNTITCEVLDCQ